MSLHKLDDSEEGELINWGSGLLSEVPKIPVVAAGVLSIRRILMGDVRPVVSQIGEWRVEAGSEVVATLTCQVRS